MSDPLSVRIYSFAEDYGVHAGVDHNFTQETNCMVKLTAGVVIVMTAYQGTSGNQSIASGVTQGLGFGLSIQQMY
jgi:hypothetical protein